MSANSEFSWPLPNVPPALLAEKLRAKLSQRLSETKLFDYRPYDKQRAFHDAGLKCRERLFRAGNQLGKTLAGAAEVAFHATAIIQTGGRGGAQNMPPMAGSAHLPANSSAMAHNAF